MAVASWYTRLFVGCVVETVLSNRSVVDFLVENTSEVYVLDSILAVVYSVVAGGRGIVVVGGCGLVVSGSVVVGGGGVGARGRSHLLRHSCIDSKMPGRLIGQKETFDSHSCLS